MMEANPPDATTQSLDLEGTLPRDGCAETVTEFYLQNEINVLKRATYRYELKKVNKGNYFVATWNMQL